MEDARQAGDCDSGYSCAYTNNLAWSSETQPLPPILDPRALFERLFGNGVAAEPAGARAQAKYRRSILDFVSEDTRGLEATSGPPTGASWTNIFFDPREWNGRSKKRRRITRKSTRTWKSRTECRQISPSTSS